MGLIKIVFDWNFLSQYKFVYNKNRITGINIRTYYRSSMEIPANMFNNWFNNYKAKTAEFEKEYYWNYTKKTYLKI